MTLPGPRARTRRFRVGTFSRCSLAVVSVVALLALLPWPASAAGAASGQMGAGTEHRDWVTGPEDPLISRASFDITEQDDLFVTMRDGVKLQTDLFLPTLPAGTSAPPCVLIANGYGIDGTIGTNFKSTAQDLAKRGYSVVHASLRGQSLQPPAFGGKSEGSNDLYNQYGQDGFDLVEWMAAQPWCNGKVGMVGASLLGISQWLTVKQAPPYLVTFLPDVACGDCYDYVWYPGGMLPGPGRKARGVPEYPSALQHRDYDAWWRARTTIAPDHLAIGQGSLSVLITGGWNDYISPANMRAFEQLTDAAGVRRQMIVGPWTHGGGRAGLMPFSFNDYQVLWLDHWLKGAANGAEARARTAIYVYGPNQWRYEHQWPIPDAHATQLFLRSLHSGTLGSLNDGLLDAAKPKPTDSNVSFDYSPASGPFLTTMRDTTTGMSTADQRPNELRALTWTTMDLQVPTEVTGWPTLTFWAESSTTDADFVAEVTDVDEQGKSSIVTAGYLNASRAASRSHPTPLVPGEIKQYQIEIWPTSYVFQTGHRIRISLAGGSQPADGQRAPQGPGADPMATRVTIFQDAAHPSWLELPVIGTGWRQLMGISGG